MNAKSVHDLGTDVVRSVVEALFQRFIDDEELFPFFSDMRLSFLKIHSLSILKTAYVGMPSGEHLANIFKLHEPLFREQGLGIVHYNRMVYHLQGALAANGVPSEVIEGAIQSLDEFKVMFQRGAGYSCQMATTPKKTRMYVKVPRTSTTSKEESSVSPNSLGAGLRQRLSKSPSFMRRSIRIITKGAA